MSSSFVRAATARAHSAGESAQRPALSHFAELATAMLPLTHALLVYNVDPATVDASSLLLELDELGTDRDLASRAGRGISTVNQALDALQCAALRAAVDNATMEYTDTVDGQLEYQQALSVGGLKELIGIAAVAKLTKLAQQSHDEMAARTSVAADAAARVAGCCTLPALPEDPHYIFVRRYSASTRPWASHVDSNPCALVGSATVESFLSDATRALTASIHGCPPAPHCQIHFHHDSALLTVNVALTADGDHEGGRLIAVDQGKVQHCKRREGTATLHASTLLHAVTRMTSGARYSLILFYRRICPEAAHALARCDAATMELLYPLDSGSYSCDVCGDSAEMMCYPGMWHCVDGCEYDVCDACHAKR